MVKILKDATHNTYLGRFSELIEKSVKGEKFALVGQDYRYRYNGFGEFEFKDANKIITFQTEVQSVVMFAENTNISSFFQLIDTIARFGRDDINMSLLYTVNDMVI